MRQLTAFLKSEEKREEADDQYIGRQLFKKGRGQKRERERPMIKASVNSLFKKGRGRWRGRRQTIDAVVKSFLKREEARRER